MNDLGRKLVPKKGFQNLGLATLSESIKNAFSAATETGFSALAHAAS
jgi:hypothetical protein